jgi:Family of unknown function (DUF6999)
VTQAKKQNGKSKAESTEAGEDSKAAARSPRQAGPTRKSYRLLYFKSSAAGRFLALYVGRLFDREEIVRLVNKKHPTVPLSTMEAGFRLMLHGLVDRRAEQSHSMR